MSKKGIAIFILFSFFIVLSPIFIAADTAIYRGNVTISNSTGSNLTAETGTVIDAYVNGVWKANTTVKSLLTHSNGYYAFVIVGSTGDNLFFKVWGQNASSSLIYSTDLPFVNLTMVAAANSAACTFSKGCNGGYCCNGGTELNGRALSGGTCQASACNAPPVLNASTQSATSVTVGAVVTFNVNVSDASNSISNVSAELENPNAAKTNYSMTLASGTNSAGNTLRYELNFTTISPSGTWYVKFYVNDTSGNIGNTSDRNLTLTVNAASSSSSSSGGGGGGSGGGGGGSASTTVTESQSVQGTVDAGTTASFSYAKASDTGISSVEVAATTAFTNPQITVKQTTLASTQSAAISSTSGAVYQYLSITKTNIKDTDFNTAKIKFQVKKSWVTTNGIDYKTVALSRYSNNAWSKLTTKFVKEDSTYYYYEATTPGFSLFAITGEKKTSYTAFEVIDIIRNFYSGSSTYTAFDIIDIIRKFYAGG